ncbi:MAG: hypothetical protein LH485_06425, partial [Sphingomonas bacterium]|nr:hypothetical protein [Sphingomonas bacterium]
WTFVVWGGLHGLYLSVERWLKQRFAGYRPGRAMLVAIGTLTFVLINITWVFFRAKDFTVAATILHSMAGMGVKPIGMIAALPMIYAMTIVAGIVATHWAMRDKTLEIAIERTPAWVVGGLLSIMAIAIVAEQGKGSAFIYFQF